MCNWNFDVGNLSDIPIEAVFYIFIFKNIKIYFHTVLVSLIFQKSDLKTFLLTRWSSGVGRTGLSPTVEVQIWLQPCHLLLPLEPLEPTIRKVLICLSLIVGVLSGWRTGRRREAFYLMPSCYSWILKHISYSKHKLLRFFSLFCFLF